MFSTSVSYEFVAMAKYIVLVFCVLAYFQFGENCATDKDTDKVFREYQIVPDVIPEAPKKFLKVLYSNGLKVNKGNELTPTQVKNQPIVKWVARSREYYTLIMTDPDAPSRAEPSEREFRHWLVANIPGNRVNKGEVVAAYVGSGPPLGTGLHRYTFILYKQPGKITIDEPHVANNSSLNRFKFKTAEFAKKYNLGTPVAGNFYQAQYDDYVPVIHQQLGLGN